MVTCGYKSLSLSLCLKVLFFMLNHFSQHNAAFAVGHVFIGVLLPSKKIGFKRNCEVFSAVWDIERNLHSDGE